MIEKRGSKFVLYSRKKGKDGKRKVLGRFDSRKAAKNHEREVQFFKHKGKVPNIPKSARKKRARKK